MSLPNVWNDQNGKEKCPDCEGEGHVFFRYSEEYDICSLCEGRGWLRPLSARWWRVVTLIYALDLASHREAEEYVWRQVKDLPFDGDGYQFTIPETIPDLDSYPDLNS